MKNFLFGILVTLLTLIGIGAYAESVGVSVRVPLTADNCMSSIKSCVCPFEY